MSWLRKAWQAVRTHWKAVFGVLSVLAVLVYKLLSDRHRRKAIALKGEAQRAEGGKVERIKDAVEARHKAGQHGRKANQHQDEARKVIKRLEGKRKDGKMGAAEAEELAKRIAGEQ